MEPAVNPSPVEPPAQSTPKRHYVRHTIMIIVALLCLAAILQGALYGFVGLAMVILYFYASERAKQPQISKSWNRLAVAIATVFIVTGLGVVALFMLLIAAFSGWGGSGGYGGGNGK